jgi:hypothetical protein
MTEIFNDGATLEGVDEASGLDEILEAEVSASDPSPRRTLFG